MWRIVPPTPVPTLPVGVWVRSATLISNDKNAAERKINPSGSREQSEKELSLQSLNLIAVTPKRLKQTKIALCMVVVVETPTRLLLRPRTPKRRAFIYLNLIDMTETMQALLDAENGWDFTLTEKMKTTIESFKAMETNFNTIIDGLIPDNADCKEEDAITNEVNNAWWTLETAIEKQMLRQLHADTYGKIPAEPQNKPVGAFSVPS